MAWKSRELTYKLAIPLYKELRKNKSYDFDNYKPYLIQVFDKNTNENKSVIAKHKFHEIYFYKGFIPVSVSSGTDGTVFSYLKFTFPFEKILTKILKNVQPETYESYHYIEEVRGQKRELSLSRFTEAGSSSNSSGQAPQSPKTPIIYSSFDLVDQGLGDLVGDEVNHYLVDKPIQFKTKYVFTKQGLEIKEQVSRWAKSEEWYSDRGILYRRGLCLFSSPGQGKSALIHEIAKEIKLPLFIVDVSSFDNKEFCEKLTSIDYVKGILLFEDFDNTFNGRENVNKTDLEKGVTFDCFINKLSGAKAIKNKFVFITTNKLGIIDSSVLRPGRIDEIIELEPLNLDEKRQVAKVIVGDDEIIDKLIEGDDGASTASWENVCVTAALQNFWKK